MVLKSYTLSSEFSKTSVYRSILSVRACAPYFSETTGCANIKLGTLDYSFKVSVIRRLIMSFTTSKVKIFFDSLLTEQTDFFKVVSFFFNFFLNKNKND